jgi:arabinofuranan 3-O-arabinosyltransferase
VWGQPRDDALQPVADGPWTVRDAAPLAQPGYIRLLDSIESTLAAGQRDPSLAPVLARSGIRYLIVRNDLDAGTSNSTPLRFVHATISNSPGFALAATFGPSLSPPYDPGRLVDLGLTRAEGAVQVYENTDWSAEAALLPADGTVVANGSSDQLAQVVATGLSPRTPVVFGAEPSALKDAGASTTTVLTEGTRRREFGFGGINRYSATMTADQPYTAERAVHDYLPAGSGELSTTEYTGISGIRTSSAATAAQSGWAALDGDPKTAWVSTSIRGAVGQWIQVDLPRAIATSSIQISFAAGRSTYPTRLRVATDAGVVDDEVSPDSNTQTLRLPAGKTRSIRLTVSEMAVNQRGSAVALAALTVPGVLPSRSLAIPGTPDPDVVSFSVLNGARPPCLTVSGAAACDSSWAAAGEEDTALDRTFATARSARYRVQVGVRLRPGPELNNLLDAGNPLRALASSVDSADPRERAGAAIDGDPTTGWVAKSGDRLPSIEVTTSRAHRLDGIELRSIPGALVTVPTRVLITVGGSSFVAEVPADGRVRFPHPAMAAKVQVAVVASSVRITTDSATGRRRLLPVGIGEIKLLGDNAPTGHVADEHTLGCGAGPTLLLNGASIRLSLDAVSAQVLAGTPVTAQPCGPATVRLVKGTNRIRVAADGLFSPDSITMSRAPTASSAVSSAGDLHVLSWGDTRREVRVATTALTFLSVAENANAGWSATLNGRPLAAVTLDGWHQGWLVPAGSTGVVHLVFTPQRIVDRGVVLGALAILVLLALAFVRPRRRLDIAPAGETAPRRGRVLVVGVVGLGALGGVAGVLVLAAVVIARGEWHRRWRAAVGSQGIVLPRGAEATLAIVPILLAGAAESIGSAGSARPLAGAGWVQLLCLVTIALVVAALLPSRAPRPAVPAQQRPLDQVVGDGGGGSGAERSESEQLDEVAAEDGPPDSALDEDQKRQVP